MTQLPILQTRKDIVTLVDKFYANVQQNLLLGPVFVHLDWNIHKPIMYNFWASMMLGEQTYQGNPFQKHVHLKINASHFREWLNIFSKTVDENFQGEKADEIKERAKQIAGVFQHKLGLMSTP